MGFLIPQRCFDPNIPEMIDRWDIDKRLLKDDLRNLRTINKLFGGLSAIHRHILPMFERVSSEKEIRILDLATGSADHPRALARLSRIKEKTVQITAVDFNPQTVAIARNLTLEYPEILLEQKNILALDYPDKSFDIVLCSLAIHHFSFDDAEKIVREMKRLSRVGFIVNDLNRTWPGAWTTWLYTHLTTLNRMTLNDSYLSVLRAFTPDELREIAHKAGLQRFSIIKQPFFRLILVGEG